MITRRNIMLSGALAGSAMLLKNLPVHAEDSAKAQANPASGSVAATGSASLGSSRRLVRSAAATRRATPNSQGRSASLRSSPFHRR